MKNYNTTIIKNEEKFETFLKKNVKAKSYNLEAYYDDLIQQYETNGFGNYELSNFETTSGNPECISFATEIIYEDDMVKTIIEF